MIQERVFQSTPPAWGATYLAPPHCLQDFYFNPRPPHGGRQLIQRFPRRVFSISIHAPRMGGDCLPWNSFPGASYFNPRPPHGGRLGYAFYNPNPLNFNPRPPHGGRRSGTPIKGQYSQFQSTPPAWGATKLRIANKIRYTISIHAPRMGGDVLCLVFLVDHATFQSTPPAWGATREREGNSTRGCYFNPRPPHGGRQP